MKLLQRSNMFGFRGVNNKMKTKKIEKKHPKPFRRDFRAEKKNIK